MRHRPRTAGTVLACAGVLLFSQLAQAQTLPPQEAASPAKQTAEAPALPIDHLYPAGQVKFGMEGPGAVLSGVQCDTDGNIYYSAYPSMIAAEQFLRHGVFPGLTKLSVGSEAVVNFPVDKPSGYASSYSRGFYVSPRGDVYGLVAASRHAKDFKGSNWPRNLVVEYNDDGTVDQVVKLSPPENVHFLADKLAVFPDGTILAAGEKLAGPGKPESGPFTGVFDRGGGFIAGLDLPRDLGPHERAPREGKPAKAARDAVVWMEGVRAGLMVGSPDGTIYLIRASSPARVYVLGSGGVVLRAFDIKPPRPAMQPAQAAVTQGGNLVVLYHGSPYTEEPRFPQTLALVDPQAGEITASYDIPSGAGIPACGTRNEILFLRSDNSGDVEVAKFVPQ